MFESRISARGRALFVGQVVCVLIAIACPAPTVAKTTMLKAGSAQRVAFGQQVVLAGNAAPRSVVTLEHAPSARRWRAVSRTTVNAGGRYRFAPRVRLSGRWRAVSDSGVRSANYEVTVAARIEGRLRRHLLGVRPVSVTGRLKPGLGGRPVRLELRTRGRWRLVDRTRTRKGGAYRASFRPTGTGVYRLRARFPGNAFHAGDVARLRAVSVYSPGGASWYGPGFYGGRTACGQTLTGSIKGVAHRSLPCGTRVRLYYHGRSVTARVIDRGPYHGGRSWDLTPATKQALGFGSTGTVWAAY